MGGKREMGGDGERLRGREGEIVQSGREVEIKIEGREEVDSGKSREMKGKGRR